MDQWGCWDELFLTIRSPIIALENSMNPNVGSELLTQSCDVIIRQDGRV